MEEYHPKKQSPPIYPTSHNLAEQPYLFTDDDEPMEEEANVVPLPKSRSIDSIAEDPLQPRSPTKRKQSNTSKGRASNKKASTKAVRSSHGTKRSSYTNELQHLEAMAERINQILAERSQRKQWADPSQAKSPAPGRQPLQGSFVQQYPQSQGPSVGESSVQPFLDDEETETLRQHSLQIQNRLSQLEAFMDDVEEDPYPPEAPVNPKLAYTEFDYYQSPRQSAKSIQAPGAAQNRQTRYSHPSQQQVQPGPPSQSFQVQGFQPPASTDHTPSDPIQQRSEYDAWLAAQELRRLQHQEQSAARSPAYSDAGYEELERGYHEANRDAKHRYPAHRERSRPRQSPSEPTLRRYSLSLLRNLQAWHIFDLPRKPVDRVGDATVWIVAAIVVRVSSRYFLLSFPFLTPVFTLLMLTPAVIALLLALFAPKTNWVLFYRLFLIMLGLFIGGKF